MKSVVWGSEVTVNALDFIFIWTLWEMQLRDAPGNTNNNRKPKKFQLFKKYLRNSLKILTCLPDLIVFGITSNFIWCKEYELSYSGYCINFDPDQSVVREKVNSDIHLLLMRMLYRRKRACWGQSAIAVRELRFDFWEFWTFCLFPVMILTVSFWEYSISLYIVNHMLLHLIAFKWSFLPPRF